MRSLALLGAALLLLGCRTRFADFGEARHDLAAPGDAATAADLAFSVDAATSDGGVACGQLTCDAATEVCVFLNRGDCSAYACSPVPATCASDRSCACLGDAFCAQFLQGGEKLTCTPSDFPPGPDIVVCTSTVLCV
jgi:hypothetical protein